jgi:hypothetical protein
VEGVVERYLKLESVHTDEGNIAGVAIPVLEEVSFDRKAPDLFETPAWLDDGIEMLEQLIRFRAERLVKEEQRLRLREELRTTNQRVNLFEKVKIPECKEHIRVIRIFLGDQQTAAVARAKIAKEWVQKETLDARERALQKQLANAATLDKSQQELLKKRLEELKSGLKPKTGEPSTVPSSGSMKPKKRPNALECLFD